METASFSKADLNLEIDICVPAEDVEHPDTTYRIKIIL